MPATLEKKTHGFRSILMAVVDDFRRGFLGWRNSIKEDGFQNNADGSVNLANYTESVEYYIQLYDRFLEISAKGYAASQNEREIAWSLRLHGQRGMIAKGGSSIPYALNLLSNVNPDAREDGASIFVTVSKNPDNASILESVLEKETDDVARTAIIEALGACKNHSSIPALAKIIRNETTDEITKEFAIRSLGQIIGVNLEKLPDPVKSAEGWLKSNDY